MQRQGEQINLPVQLQGCKSVSLVVEIDCKCYYVFHDDQNIFMGLKQKNNLQIKQQWKFPKIRDIQKIVGNYFYIITQDHKIGIYWFESFSSISTYVQNYKFQSYFIHEVKKNVFEVQIFKSDLEVNVFQITGNNKKTDGSFRLETHPQGYNVLSEKKKLILAPKYLINSTRRLILSRSNSKDPFFYSRKFPQHAYFLIGLANTTQYVAFTNKIEYFDPFLSAKPKKLQHPLSYKYIRCYLRHNYLIVTPENHPYAYIIQILTNGAQVVSRLNSQEEWVFGIDSTEVVAIFNKMMLCRKLSQNNQTYAPSSFKKVSNVSSDNSMPNTSNQQFGNWEFKQPRQKIKIQETSKLEPNRIQITQETQNDEIFLEQPDKPNKLITYKIKQKGNQIEQINSKNKNEQNSHKIITVSKIQGQLKRVSESKRIGSSEVEKVNQKLQSLVLKIKQSTIPQDGQATQKIDIIMKEELKKMLVDYVDQYLPAKIQRWISQINQNNREFSKNQTKKYQNQLKKLSVKDQKRTQNIIQAVKEHNKVQNVQYLQQNQQINTDLYYNWKTEIKEVQNAVLFLKRGYEDLLKRTNTKHIKANELLSNLSIITNLLHPFSTNSKKKLRKN